MITRECDPQVLLAQIGRMNVAAISGGRVRHLYVGTERHGISLPVAHGYAVEVWLAANDTYTVRRVFTRGGKRFVKGERTNVYADQVGEVAYQASCYVNVEFGE